MIRLGPAGTSGLGYENCFKLLADEGLNALEVEFVYGVRMNNEMAKKIGILAKDYDIKLSVHGPYYINLNSKDKAKIEASKKRILLSCERAHYLNASPVVFHAAFYGKDKEEVVYEKVKKALQDIMQVIKQKGWNVEIAPETTGKKSQFAGIDTLLKLKEDIGCSICIDFAHLIARDRLSYEETCKRIKNLKEVHAHFSSIEYGEKGERRHLLTSEKDIKALAEALKKFKIKNITIINESDNPIEDSVKTREIFKKFGLI